MGVRVIHSVSVPAVALVAREVTSLSVVLGEEEFRFLSDIEVFGVGRRLATSGVGACAEGRPMIDYKIALAVTHLAASFGEVEKNCWEIFVAAIV